MQKGSLVVDADVRTVRGPMVGADGINAAMEGVGQRAEILWRYSVNRLLQALCFPKVGITPNAIRFAFSGGEEFEAGLFLRAGVVVFVDY